MIKITQLGDLIHEALDKKWYFGSSNLVFANCIFCIYAKENYQQKMKTGEIDNREIIHSVCDFCLCPKYICDNHSLGGLMGEFHAKYKFANINTTTLIVKEMSYADLKLIISTFEKYLKRENGYQDFVETYNLLKDDNCEQY